MQNSEATLKEQPMRGNLSLDPADWQAFTGLAHEALDQVLAYQETIRSKPVWKPVPPKLEAELKQAAPLKGLGEKTVIQDMLDCVLNYPAGHAHPRFWGWVAGTGTAIGTVADLLASGVNASSGVFNDIATRIESQLIGWMRDLFQFPTEATGLVTSGASVANIIGLAVGRDAQLGQEIRQQGLSGLDSRPVVYASQQVHSSVDKAMGLLGLGLESLRKVPVNERYEMCLGSLEDMISQDRSRGMRPIAVVASAGTVNTGAIDDLGGVAKIAKANHLWFHIDGAIGALANISPELKVKFAGLELADSLAFDFHKWLYAPYEAGCVLIRDGAKHRASFQVNASYLEAPARGIGAVPDSSNIRGLQLSRGFKALKVWAQIRDFGLEKIGQLQHQNVRDVHYLKELILAHQDLELMAPVALNILCFRYQSKRLECVQWNDLNKELLMRLHEQGLAAPSSTVLNGNFVLRVANTNHRTRRNDFDALVEYVCKLGREIEREWQ